MYVGSQTLMKKYDQYLLDLGYSIEELEMCIRDRLYTFSLEKWFWRKVFKANKIYLFNYDRRIYK